MTIVVAAVFMLYVWPNIDNFVAPALRRWVAIGLMLFCCIPQIAWTIFFPASIDITAYKKSVDYEFADIEYAYDFAELNHDAEWARIK